MPACIAMVCPKFFRKQERQPIIHRLISDSQNPNWDDTTTWYVDSDHIEDPASDIILIQLDKPCIQSTQDDKPCIHFNGLDIVKGDAHGWLYHKNYRYSLKRYDLLEPSERRKLEIFSSALAVWEIRTHRRGWPLE